MVLQTTDRGCLYVDVLNSDFRCKWPSKNNFSELDISQNLVWQCPSLSPYFLLEKSIPRVLTPVHHSRPRGVSKECLFFPIHIAFVFERFIFRPEHFSKLSRGFITFFTGEILASVAAMSSTHNKYVVSSSPIFIPSIC